MIIHLTMFQISCYVLCEKNFYKLSFYGIIQMNKKVNFQEK